MGDDGFTFKQFRVNHDRCAMKVGTDGVLLGAWADISQARRILDLGTGTGLVALMLAQRTPDDTQISAVEIDQAAFYQATENVRASPWANKIRVYHQDIMQFRQKCGQNSMRFELVVANPPYFMQGTDCRTNARNIARYTAQQTHSDWLNAAADCVTSTGKIQFILPFEEGKILLQRTALCCVEYCEVITKAGKAPQRLLLTFSPTARRRRNGRLVIYTENNRYHPDFIALTRDFYLKF